MPAPEASCQGFGWKSQDSTSSLEALGLEMESSGRWEEGEKKGECHMDQMGKWGGREVRALLFRCFLSFLLTLLLSSAHFFFSPSSCFWSHLESALDLLFYCYNQTNVSQVFPIVRLRITWWVREETGRGSTIILRVKSGVWWISDLSADKGENCGSLCLPKRPSISGQGRPSTCWGE